MFHHHSVQYKEVSHFLEKTFSLGPWQVLIRNVMRNGAGAIISSKISTTHILFNLTFQPIFMPLWLTLMQAAHVEPLNIRSFLTEIACCICCNLVLSYVIQTAHETDQWEGRGLLKFVLVACLVEVLTGTTLNFVIFARNIPLFTLRKIFYKGRIDFEMCLFNHRYRR